MDILKNRKMEGQHCPRSKGGVCGACKPICKEFKKVLNLKDSDLVIYLHNKDEDNQQPSPRGKKEKIVLYNTSEKVLKRSDYIKDFSKYKTQCFRCNTILQQIRGLLDEIKEIRENEVRAVCQYCKKPNYTGQCSRCHHLVGKFLSIKVKEYDQRIQRFDEWLSKVKHILHAILEESYRAKGKGLNQKDLESSEELEKLLLELKTPLRTASHQPRIKHLLDTQSVSSAASIAESKEILEKLLGRLKTVTKVFKPPEEVKSVGSSSISLPAIKTVFKVLPKKPLPSGFTLLPPSSEMIPSQRSFFKDVALSKKTQFEERDLDRDEHLNGDRDRERGRNPGQDRGRECSRSSSCDEDLDRDGDRNRGKGHRSQGLYKDRDRDRERYGNSDQDRGLGTDRARARSKRQDENRELAGKRKPMKELDTEMLSAKSVTRGKSLKRLIKDKNSMTNVNGDLFLEEEKDKDKEKINEDAFMGFIGRITKEQAEAKNPEILSNVQDKDSTDKEKEIVEDGQWPKKPSIEKSSLSVVIKKGESKRHVVNIAYKGQSLTRIEGFEIPKEVKRSRSLIIMKPLFTVTAPETDLEVTNEAQEATSRSESDGDEKGTAKKGKKEKFVKYDGDKKKSKREKGGRDGDDTKGKKKSQEKKKLQVKAKSEGSESDESEISGEEQDKEKPHQQKKSPRRKQAKPSASIKLLLRLLKQREKEKKFIQKAEKSKSRIRKMPFIANLPELKYRKRKADAEDYETAGDASIVECESDTKSLKMIKGTQVIKYDPHYKDEKPKADVQPLLFRAQPVCLTPPLVPKVPSVSEVSETRPEQKVASILGSLNQTVDLKGVLRYALSNREYIENGYTVLPTVKIMRKLNIYKMVPAKPKNDWFAGHKHQGVLFYDTGEKFAEIDEDGHGRWYYRNGKLALDYHKAEEEHAENRYVIYSSGQRDGFHPEPITVLGSFDHNGNGVVYDECGNVRIKYNQTEGVVMDRRIGPLSRWKWHDLNDPPALQPVFVENYLEHRGACLENLFNVTTNAVEEDIDLHTKEANEKMLNIELDNFFRDKAYKLLQKYNPFQIRMKALRLSEQFSLKVIDQANIYLLFRDGQISFKLNLGMSLISNEILDIDTAEASQVLTSYDRIFPRSDSVADIKGILDKTKKGKKCRRIVGRN